MTLLEILVKELPKRGGWIEGTFIAAQDGNGDVCFYTEGEIMFSRHFHAWLIKPFSTANHDEENRLKLGMADDWRDSVVTREQYEAALSASTKPEWNGDYPIPAGTEVDVHFDGDDSRVWTKFRVEYMRAGVVVLYDYRIDSVDAYKQGVLSFRPIRSEADRKRDEAVGAMLNAQSYGGQDVYCDIYDAIAAGKIPGIRIE